MATVAKPGDLVLTSEPLYYNAHRLGGIYRVCRPVGSMYGAGVFFIPKGQVGLVVGDVGPIEDMIAVLMPDNDVYALFPKQFEVVQSVDDAK